LPRDFKPQLDAAVFAQLAIGSSLGLVLEGSGELLGRWLVAPLRSQLCAGALKPAADGAMFSL